MSDNVKVFFQIWSFYVSAIAAIGLLIGWIVIDDTFISLLLLCSSLVIFSALAAIITIADIDEV